MEYGDPVFPVVEPSMPTFASTPPRSQSFSLPHVIIYYLTQNPTNPEIWNKLIRACKYFLHTHPVIPLKDLQLMTNTADGGNGEEVVWDVLQNRRSNQYETLEEWVKMETYTFGSHVDLNAVPFKFWLMDRARFYSASDAFKYFIRNKVYRFDMGILKMHNLEFEYSDLVLLTRSPALKEIIFGNPWITDVDGSIVRIEKILETIPNIVNARL